MMAYESLDDQGVLGMVIQVFCGKGHASSKMQDIRSRASGTGKNFSRIKSSLAAGPRESRRWGQEDKVKGYVQTCCGHAEGGVGLIK